MNMNIKNGMTVRVIKNTEWATGMIGKLCRVCTVGEDSCCLVDNDGGRVWFPFTHIEIASSNIQQTPIFSPKDRVKVKVWGGKWVDCTVVSVHDEAIRVLRDDTNGIWCDDVWNVQKLS